MDSLSSSYKAIWKLAWPQILMMLFHFLIGFVDVWVAGRLGRDVQACMGMITQALFFFLVVAIALANGSVAAISQSVGAGLIRRVQRYIGLGLEIGVVLGFVFLVAGFLFRDGLLELLQVPDEIMPIAAYLLKVYLYVLPGYYLLIICNAFFRAQKKVMIPLFAMMIVTAVNTFGDFAFGLGMWGFPEYGYKGLAWSTFGSVLCGTVFSLVVLYRHGLLKRKSFAPWCWIKKAFPYLFKVAWPAGLMQLVWHSAYMVLYAITAALPLGSVVALAGMSAGIRVESLLFLPGFAFNFTASILVGNYLGQGDIKGAKRMGYLVMLFGLGLVSTLTLLLWLVIEPVAGFIAPDPEVSLEAVNYLKYNMAAMPFLLVSMILGGALTGAGATFYQMIVMGSSAWLVRIPLAWYLGHVHMQEATGIWLAMFISMVVQALLMLYFYQIKDWTRFSMKKTKRAIQPSNTINKFKAGK
ncbi:MATE family efflux transporter [Desulfonatronovibrio hydrogenovorans]|uniref:MATE family efflux transporter n=1 Tax=Desulfonatronovibrio hydrogenovorans TaxID=53245 RepID=UPI00048E4F76